MKLLLLLALISDLRIQFILLKGPNGLNKHEARHVIKEAKERYLTQALPFGYGIRYRLQVLHKDPSRTYANLKSFGQKFYYLQGYVQREGLCRRAQVCHVLTPGIMDSGKLWGTGLAYRCSVNTRLKFSISTAFLHGSDGQSYETRTINTIAHEIFHQLGAYHHSGINIMDPDANSITKKAGTYPLPVLDQTRQEINLCLRARGMK